MKKTCLQLWNGLLILIISISKLIGNLADKARAKTLVEIFIRKGDVSNAVNAAFAEERKLTREELDRLAMINLEKEDYYSAYKAAALGASRELSEEVLANVLSRGYIGSSRDLAKKLGRELTYDEVAQIISNKIKSSSKLSLWDIDYVEKEFRKLTREENEFLLRLSLEAGSTECAIEIARRLGREITGAEADQLLCSCTREGLTGHGFKAIATGKTSADVQGDFILSLIDTKDVYDYPTRVLETIKYVHAQGLISDKQIISMSETLFRTALEEVSVGVLILLSKPSLAAGFIRKKAESEFINLFYGLEKNRAPKEYFEMFLVEAVKHGHPSYALQAAEQLGRNLTNKEVETIFKKLVEGGWLSNVEKFARQTGRQPTAKEMESCLKAKMKRDK